MAVQLPQTFFLLRPPRKLPRVYEPLLWLEGNANWPTRPDFTLLAREDNAQALTGVGRVGLSAKHGAVSRQIKEQLSFRGLFESALATHRNPTQVPHESKPAHRMACVGSAVSDDTVARVDCAIEEPSKGWS